MPPLGTGRRAGKGKGGKGGGKGEIAHARDLRNKLTAKDEAHRRVGVVAAVVLAIIWRVESTLLR